MGSLFTKSLLRPSEVFTVAGDRLRAEHERGKNGMRRTKHVLQLLAGAALVVASVAAATRSHPQTSDVSASFTTSQTRMHTRTCTEGANTFRVTDATWRGTSTSDENRLDGTLVIRTHTVLNETTGDGWLSGSWHSRHSPTERS